MSLTQPRDLHRYLLRSDAEHLPSAHAVRREAPVGPGLAGRRRCGDAVRRALVADDCGVDELLAAAARSCRRG